MRGMPWNSRHHNKTDRSRFLHNQKKNFNKHLVILNRLNILENFPETIDRRFKKIMKTWKESNQTNQFYRLVDEIIRRRKTTETWDFNKKSGKKQNKTKNIFIMPWTETSLDHTIPKLTDIYVYTHAYQFRRILAWIFGKH